MTDLLFFLLEISCALSPQPDCFTTRWKCAVDGGAYTATKREVHRVVAMCADKKVEGKP